MTEPFLYETLNAVASMGYLGSNLPGNITQNLNPKYQLRPYQTDAFLRFIRCYHQDFPGKKLPLHLLFNMATGSGKTLIMAGLILYLYEQGYRNFLFFVNSTNIIEKTKANFLDPGNIKYLFAGDPNISNRRVQIAQVDNFEGVNADGINICFTTIQKLHSDLTAEKENSITFEDFRKHKIVLIADEAHHINVQTRSQNEMFESWENTVERILGQNEKNILLEFTATHDYATPAMVDKYRNKVIIRYDLVQFRNDRFSKDVVIVQSDFGQQERILQALILSQYKQMVASKHRINLKPVLLFKAQRTIEQSRQNKEEFHQLIDHLSAEQIVAIRKSDIPIVQRAFRFFDENGISSEQMVERIKHDFQPDFCLSVNEDKEKDLYQILLNTLEDKNNRIRAIFAVQKLNEGWDVLNLFDIVRCYEMRDTGRAEIGTTTLSEAQLIGRGARYFPFVLPENDDRFRRKYDEDLDNELRVLEELHYHSVNDSRYIAEIRQALIEQGMLDPHEITQRLVLKETFKKTQFYNYGVIWLNDRLPKNYQRVHSFADFGVTRRNYSHIVATGHGGAHAAFAEKRASYVAEGNRVDIQLAGIDKNIIQNAISRNPFFRFSSLRRYFPNLTSLNEFIQAKEYLGSLAITFEGGVYNPAEDRSEQLSAVCGLLTVLESEIREQVTEYEGTRDFRTSYVHDVFQDKLLKFDDRNPRGKDDADYGRFVSGQDWIAFNMSYGTSEEKAFVRFLERELKILQQKHEEIYLLRNEGHFAIYNFSDGQVFQPDFVLFLREKNGTLQVYQLFIEPKGEHLKEHDRWKETFLKEITSMFTTQPLVLQNKKYRLIGIRFYNHEDENMFRAGLESALDLRSDQ